MNKVFIVEVLSVTSIRYKAVFLIMYQSLNGSRLIRIVRRGGTTFIRKDIGKILR